MIPGFLFFFSGVALLHLLSQKGDLFHAGSTGGIEPGSAHMQIIGRVLLDEGPQGSGYPSTAKGIKAPALILLDFIGRPPGLLGHLCRCLPPVVSPPQGVAFGLCEAIQSAFKRMGQFLLPDPFLYLLQLMEAVRVRYGIQ